MDTEKRILLIDREYKQESRNFYHSEQVFISLSRKFNIDQEFNLNDYILKFLEDKKAQQINYDALVSHVPYSKEHIESGLHGVEFYSESYKKSLEILRKIKEKEKIPIIAYTGADNIPIVRRLFLIPYGPIDEIVFKSDVWQEDAERIKSALERLLQA